MRREFVASRLYQRTSRTAFSLLEAVVAVMIFGLLMLAVGALWSVAWRATERIAAGGEGEAGAPFVLRRLVEAVEHSVFRSAAGGLYAWRGEDDGGGAEEFDRVSFVTTLAPDSAAGDPSTAPIERVLITAETGPRGGRQLVLRAGPLTMEEKDWQRRIVLIEDLGSFRVRYWNAERKDWADGWRDEGQAPPAVQISIARKGERVDPAMDFWALRAVARVHRPVVIETVVTRTGGESGTNAPAIRINPGSNQPVSVK